MNRRFVNARALVLTAAVLCFSPLHYAHAGPLINGDFVAANDLAGWTPTGSLVSEPTGAFAPLAIAGNANSGLTWTKGVETNPLMADALG